MSKRENQHHVAISFVSKRSGNPRSGAMSSTAHEVFSYDTCIAYWAGPDTVALTTQKYSTTTSAHTSAVREVLEANGFTKRTADDAWELWS